ncbi:MAG TPA: beta-galactosidase trimerization domain-containing protein [Armatimonadota bacterium]|nr:beta-galactosidase trimerization domain-containing protein [Armatimonadota bacterium]
MGKSKSSLNRREFLIGLVGTAAAAEWVNHSNRSLDPASAAPVLETTDAYTSYIRTSKDFQRVRHDKAWLDKAFPGWIFMPWTYQWTIGYNEASGRWSRAHGYNGAFLDGTNGTPDSPPGKLAWINQFRLHFYMCHTAEKGYLHMRKGEEIPHLQELHGNGVRTVPVNAALAAKLQGFIRDNISQVKLSPFRSAYALDDEVSWGNYSQPAMWRVTDEPDAFTTWLNEIYGPGASPAHDAWITYNDILPHLADWSVREFDASPLMDQWTFNDSFWLNFIGDLVTYANTVDPNTPCGLDGAQPPGPFGGWDYAKVMRKIQYIEPYDVGSAQAVVRSFNPRNAIPVVTTIFHKSVEDDVWQTWYFLAHGNRGHIGWVQDWFDGEAPRPWHDQEAPDFLEAGQKIGPLMLGAEWMHDGVALYYNHPSIQLGWIMDAEAHGKTWINRNNDARLGGAPLGRHAWENMLRDSGLQYNFLSYVDLIQKGIPPEYRVLILPACLCLSDAEAGVISDFVHRGGTVIADYLPGLWDQHGRGRSTGGVLDSLFGVHHNPDMKHGDVFGNRLWSEVDQEINYNWKTYQEFMTNGNTSIKDASGFNKAVRNMPTGMMKRVGAGTAVLMNLSPQWYNAYRVAGFEASRRRETFMRPLAAAGIHRWVEIEGAGEAEFGYEITYFRKPDGRTILYVCWNPETNGSDTGGGNATNLKTGAIDITLKFSKPIKGVRDERRGTALGDGDRFKLTWARNEAVVLSFA